MENIFNWISAIGVILGLPIAFWNIVKLFKRDKEKQKQLNSIDKIAKESANQVKEMQENNLHFKKQIELMENEQNVKAQERASKAYEEIKEKKKRLDKIRPIFEQFELNITVNKSQYWLVLVNIGEMAKLKEYTENSNNECFIDIDVAKPQVLHSKYVEIKLNPKNPNKDVTESKIDFNIFYVDEDRNKYKQVIRSIVNSGVIVEPPELIT